MEGRLRNMASLYITSNDNMLLLYRIGSRVVAPSWCGIGGHFEKEELNDAKAAILREVSEEIGVKEEELLNLRLKYVTLRYKNEEIRQNYYFFAELKEGVKVQEHCNEGILEWVTLDALQEREMPFTAGYIIKHYLSIGQDTDDCYCGVAHQNTVTFVKLEEF